MMRTELLTVSPTPQTTGKTIRRWQAKNMTNVICPVCGKTYVMSSGAQRYCSPACRKEAQAQREAKEKQAKEEKKHPNRSLDEDMADSARQGMSYGMWRIQKMLREQAAAGV